VKRTSLVLTAAATLLLVIVCAAWWASSPGGVRRAGQAILVIAGVASALACVRVGRRPVATPTVMLVTVVGSLVLIARPAGPLLPIVLCAFAALAWTAVSIVQSPAMRKRLSSK
jgi:hypothetical protein